MTTDLPDAVVADAPLIRVSPSGALLHVPGCSHLQTTPVERLAAASPAERSTLKVCSECEAELTGRGRTIHDSLQDAFQSVRIPTDNWPRMLEIASGLDYSQVWTPNSKGYVGIGQPGRAAVAYFNASFVGVHRVGGGYDRETFANFSSASGASRIQGTDRPAELCRTCSTELPRTGRCDHCD